MRAPSFIRAVGAPFVRMLGDSPLWLAFATVLVALVAVHCGPAAPEPMVPEGAPSALPTAPADIPDAGAPEQAK